MSNYVGVCPVGGSKMSKILTLGAKNFLEIHPDRKIRVLKKRI